MTRKPYTYILHGQEIADPYFWLEELDSVETRDWVQAQNTATAQFLDTIPQRESIRRRVTQLWNYPRCGVPFKVADRYFFLRNDGLQNQGVLFTRDGLAGLDRVLLDPNALSSDGTIALVSSEVSRDGKLLAYGLSRAGSDWEEWRIRQVDSGEDLADVLEWVKFSNVVWIPDSSGFYYCRYDAPDSGTEYAGQNFFHKVYFHVVGTAQTSDELVYERPDHKDWNFDIALSDDGHYLVFHVWAASHQNLLFYRDLRAQTPVVELLFEFQARYQFVANQGPVFLLHTDFQGPRGKLIAVDSRQAGSTERDVIPEAAQTLERVTFVGDCLLAVYLADAYTRVKVFAANGAFIREVELPGIGTATGFNGRAGDAETFFDFTSFTSPASVYHYDSGTGAATPFHRPKLVFNPQEFETRQVFYNSKDGTRIPMFIVHRRDLVMDGSNPVDLYGYGGFGVSLTPGFSISRIAWMEMGGVVAIPNLRGGGEYGEAWHQAGTKLSKQNVFDDFIAAAEWLIANRYTCSGKLAISGRSNGGLLVGACLTQRPELFAAALPGVGVMDMLRFHKFTIGWSWVSDYGSPDNPAEFPALLAYSPYHNLRSGTHYPATMVMTGDHDDRVVPGHSYKFAAALQAAHAGPAPILIRIDVRAGHGLGKPVAKQIQEVVDIQSFLVRVLNHPGKAVSA